MYITPYDTIAGKRSLEADTKEKTSSYLTLHGEEEGSQIVKTARSDNGVAAYRLLSGSAEIPAFSQPLYFESQNGTKTIVADVRPFITMTNAKNQEYKVNNFLSYGSLLERMVMTVCWIEQGPARLFGLGLFPMRVFGRLITNTLARKLNVPQEAQYNIQILACYYYYCLHDDSNEREYNQINMAKVVALIHRVTGYELRNVHELVSDLPIVRELDAFIQVLKDKTNSSRISTLTTSGLYTLLGTAVSVHDPRVTIAISLEHPPTFIGLVYTALTYKGAGKSGLGEIMKPINNSQEAQNFATAYKGLVSEFSK